MSQDRLRPQQPSIGEPIDEPRLQLATRAELAPAQQDPARLAAKVMQLLRDHGLDCSVAVDAADEEMPRTLH